MSIPLTGEQFEIVADDVRAVITEVGAGLRAFTVGDRPYVETFPADSRPPLGAGTVLVPWPNRTAAGRWTWQGKTQQLTLSEPATGIPISPTRVVVPAITATGASAGTRERPSGWP